ncbi:MULTISPECIES: YolD-like family protein [Bacillus]|uniref:YolD-like family protein n=1 Tax=Bacillus TaxID=1386 RepID=UPI001C5A8346|nr:MULTISPECIES: YolD-like family protein [Bacillus]MBW3492170.1 YolD-like family protein [Bacillus sp. FDAARGOS_1420]
MSSANISKDRGTSKVIQMTITPEQSAGTRKVIKGPIRVSPQNDRERIEDLLLQSFISEKEILITYYEEGYFPTICMTVIEINPLRRYVICIDTFDYKHTFSFIDIIDAH